MSARRRRKRAVDGPSTIAGRLRPLGYKKYAEYLASDHWQGLRRDLLFGRRCKCGAKATQLHHLTYARLGKERPSDLAPLCEVCHAGAHGKRPSKVVNTERRRKAPAKPLLTPLQERQARQHEAWRRLQEERPVIEVQKRKHNEKLSYLRAECRKASGKRLIQLETQLAKLERRTKAQLTVR